MCVYVIWCVCLHFLVCSSHKKSMINSLNNSFKSHAVKALKDKQRENYSGLTCLSGRGHLHRPRSISATISSVYVEEITHYIHILCLLLHCLTGLLMYAVCRQLPAHTSLTCLPFAALSMRPTGFTSDKTCILPHLQPFPPTQLGS